MNYLQCHPRADAAVPRLCCRIRGRRQSLLLRRRHFSDKRLRLRADLSAVDFATKPHGTPAGVTAGVCLLSSCGETLKPFFFKKN